MRAEVSSGRSVLGDFFAGRRSISPDPGAATLAGYGRTFYPAAWKAARSTVMDFLPPLERRGFEPHCSVDQPRSNVSGQDMMIRIFLHDIKQRPTRG